MELYIDGGCVNNNNRDISKRTMISCVLDPHGNVLVDRIKRGGSSNLAEFLSLQYALEEIGNAKEVEIFTDSQVCFYWFRSRNNKPNNKKLSKMNDPVLYCLIKNCVAELAKDKNIKLTTIPREENLAGHYIEDKYSL